MHKIVVDGGPSLKHKILVHCHAGQGRTAIIIGAYLLYAGLANSATEAVTISRQGRHKLFKNKYNSIYLKHFEDFLEEASELFPPAYTGAKTEHHSVKGILRRQRLILQGKDADEHKHIPKLVSECVNRLRVLTGN